MQLALDLRLQTTATFENFYTGSNHELIAYLHECLIDKKSHVYLWGKPGSGRTHLLQAIGHLATESQINIAYLPLKDCIHYSPSLLENYEQYNLLLLDDIDAIAHSEEWQIALFHLYNRMQELQHRWICTALVPPAQLVLNLKDLQSRLNASMIYQLHELLDSDKAAVLQWRATQRGLILNEEVTAYLLHHLPRDLPLLIKILDELDYAALAAKRKLTVPFVKKVLADQRECNFS